jgi:hypothetical protein
MKYVLWLPVVFILAVPVYAAVTPIVAHQRKLQRCMVYLPAMRDVKLKRWCLKQSERMP